MELLLPTCWTLTVIVTWFLSSCITPIAASSSIQCNGQSYTVNSIVTRDICVIGGGSSGTYAAIRLRDDLGESVVVVEKQGRLGGDTQTYTDPTTGIKIDVGVMVFHNLEIVQNYFARFNISLVNTNSGNSSGGPVTEYYDFRSGIIDAAYVPSDPSAALEVYAEQLAKYPYLETGFDLPYPVPEDLLLPFGEFIQKYALEGMAEFLFGFAQGLGNLLEQPTLYVFKNFGSDIITDVFSIGFLTTALHDNSLLYEAAQANLGQDVLLNSTIIDMDRGGQDYASIVVETPSGLTLIQAQKIVFAIPPKLDNLQGFDLSEAERSLFGQFLNAGYYTGLVRNSGIPNNTTAVNIGPNTLYNLPPLPGVYGFGQTAVPDLVSVLYGSASTLPDDQVREDILATVQRLQIAGKDTSATPELAVFYSHSPFELTVPPSAIAAGFYKQLYALQGQRRTFYTGAAFHTQDSSLLWEFTEALLPSIIA